MRYLAGFLLIIFVLTGCRQAPQPEAGPGEREMEQPDRESPAQQRRDSLEPVVADTPEPEVVDTLYRYFGRRVKGEGGITQLIGSAASVRFRASGDSVRVDLEVTGDEHSYVLVTRDDMFSWKYKLPGGRKTTLSVPLDAEKEWNEIGVYKLTEAVHEPVHFYGASAQALRRSAYEPEVHIEFIGNSITCGYGVDQEMVPCGSGVSYDQHNPYEAFAAKAARTMGAGYSLSSVSGAGVYRNYGVQDTLTIPERYADVSMQDAEGASWPPDDWAPDVVSICLGTNDVGAVRNGKRVAFDTEAFTGQYIAFIDRLRELYPNAAFVLVNSPMLTGDDAQVLGASLERIREHFSPELSIGVLEFRNVGNSGCKGHPGMQDHDMMSRQLRSFLIKTLDEISEGEDEVMS